MLPRNWFLPRKPPWIYIAITVGAFVIQCNPGWRATLVFDRAAIFQGQLWRVWTGHLVHFGWPHFFPDTGLFFVLGWLLEERHRFFSRLAVFLMPAFISGIILWLDPAMNRYGGLSALDLGLLLYLAGQGWQRNWTDWFWPAVIGIYVLEIVVQAYQGGHGGGTIRFDEPSIQIATSAHLAGTAYALVAWLLSRRYLKKTSAA